MKIWDAENLDHGEPIRTLPSGEYGFPSSVAVSANGSRIIYSTENGIGGAGTVKIIDWSTNVVFGSSGPLIENCGG